MVATPMALSWVMLLVLGGAGSLFAGGAPLPPDPVLAAVAPEECLLYTCYSGQQEASADSSNQTEQLFAEPQVQRFFTELESQIMNAVRRGVGPQPQQQALLKNVPALLGALISRPAAMFVEDVRPAANGVSVEAGMVINAGDQRTVIQTAVADLFKAAGPQAPRFTKEAIAGIEWQRIALPPEAPPVRWTWKDDYLLLAVGETTPGKLIERMAGSAPAWLDAVRKRHGEVEREMSLLRIDIAGILERIQPLVAAENPQAWPVVERLGLSAITELTARGGYDAEGCVASSLLKVDGEPRGLLALLPHKQLKQTDLAPVPRDSLIAVAVELDPTEFFDSVMELASQFNPRAQAEVQQGFRQFEAQLGVDLQGDVIDSLGDTWTVYLPNGDLFSSWLSAAAAVQVKDAGRLSEAVTKLCAVARMQMQQGEATIVESRVGEHTLYTLQFLRNPVPVSPAWCVSDEWLVVGLLPQAVRAAVERQPDETLADAPGVAEAIGGADGAALLVYQDTPRLVQSFYPWLQVFAQVAAGELRKQGINIDPSIVPTTDAIVRHMRPSTTTWAYGPDGYRAVSRGSLPSSGGGPAMVGVGTALLLPAVQSAREAARSTQDMNDMKQIMLAMLNYESAHGEFPGDIVDDEGKPLLSWRVAILPYMEEQALYDQLHLDEPWDSEHNREILAAVGTPEVFQSGLAPVEPGKTRYMGLKGPGTIWDRDQPIRFREVTDGTSNTLAIVQADPDKAVEWAKPGDLPFDPEQPRRGLTGGGKGVFLGALCDGSVHRVSDQVADETIVGASTYSGGEVGNLWQEFRGR